MTPAERLGPSSVSADSLKLAAFLPEGAMGTDSPLAEWAQVAAKAASLLEPASQAVGALLEWEFVASA